ncbi:PREDICTED: uncharacterized protein LOC104611804 [Nelumbo nucifera]|uniref:Uncharacterized protein LOC104611804 n=1 Tax=Nelumbo nucifera TaxID=4432 RepID=A0A1U8BKF0_NELNU|nr:PREDICTED: uncharacterized protein LOC104611804 [Nelumbo nucifera]
MASTLQHHLFIAFISLGLLAIGASARPGVHFHPCKTLFISYTISSLKPSNSLDFPQNPNSADPNPSGFFAVFSEIREFDPKPNFFHSSEFFIDRPDFSRPRVVRSYGNDMLKSDVSPRPVPFSTFGVSSLRERTKDILSVVVALLFGVGCGALTSATMYLAWSLITNRYEIRESEDYSEDFSDDVDDDIAKAKKMGYVKIPASEPSAAPVTSLPK